MASLATPTPAKVAVLAPLAAAFPEGPKRHAYFTDAQWSLLLSIFDAVMPRVAVASSPQLARLTPAEKLNTLVLSDSDYQAEMQKMKDEVQNPPDEEAMTKFLWERGVELQGFEEGLSRMLGDYTRKDQRDGLTVLLSALTTRVGAYLITGYSTPMDQLDIATRTAIIGGWRTSRIAAIRGLYKSFTLLSKTLYMKFSPLFPSISEYSPIPHNYTVGKSYPYTFLQFPSSPTPVVLEYDVVIVGSGVGGGITAKNLSEAGFRVLVIDKAYYYPAEYLPMSEAATHIHLLENGGVDTSEDGSLNVISGSNWGGGGTINWSASLQPQAYVRREWSQDRNLPLFESAEFQEALDRVCKRMGVDDKPVRHNHGNRVLLDGARKLGLSAKAVPQNSAGAEHYCGHCTLGCASCEKQGPNVSWLKDAAEAGAEFIEGLECQDVVFKQIRGKKTAVGIRGLWTSRNSQGGVDGPASGKIHRSVLVKAKKVILSAGSMWSPTLLRKSGLKNPQIGKNLYMHPVNTLSAIFPSVVKPWEGAPLTTVVSSFEDLDKHGHGVKIEATCMLPTYSLILHNWNNGAQFKFFSTKYKHLNTYICIVRDRDPGSVIPDPASGKPRIRYTVSDFDGAHAMRGVIETAKILLVEGAKEILVNQFGTPSYIPRDDEPRDITFPRFVAWLKEIEKLGNKAPDAVYMCAHQMGSNRMSAKASQGAVDPNGRVWETEGLYVMDASVFPSASGVNPMVTNLAIQEVNSRRLAKILKAEVEMAKL